MGVGAFRVALCAALVGAFSASALAQDDPLYVTIEIQVNKGMAEGFIELMNEAAVDTRNFEGCRYFAILVDNADPHKVVFYEIWDSADDLEAYRQWRSESDFGEQMGPFLARPPTTRTYALASD